jgi:hypothetical protein
MELEFGKKVYKESLKLQEQGKDANQIAAILCDQDTDGHNYGIGIILTGEGKPATTSSTLLEYAKKELADSGLGSYRNSNKLLEDAKIATLQWQRIPKACWDKFKLALPSDAGTGAVISGVEIALSLNQSISTLGIEELGWPAYKAMARVTRLDCREFSTGEIITGDLVLPIYQAGPINTTGLVHSPETIQARAKSAADTGTFVILDRAYPGFEYASRLASSSYDEIMTMSYEAQIKPFIDANIPFCIAIGPTKAFVSFALRPCGLLLVYCPDDSKNQEITTAINTTMRARGSSFEHPVTRAFVKTMINDRERMESEHQNALERLARSEAKWKELSKGTPIEYLFSNNYAGLFRNTMAKENAAQAIYDEHIYPVFAGGRCRLNVTGIPDDEGLAKKHVAVFAEQCY